MEYIEKGTVLIGLDMTIARTHVEAGDSHFANKAVDLIQTIRDYVAGQPASDVVAVVRCPQCKYVAEVEGGVDYCALHSAACCGFCEDGERK